MVLPRIITAILLVPIVLPIIWVGSFPFFIFVLAITILGFWEYSNMAEQGGYPNQLVMGIAGSFLILMALFLDGVVLWGPVHKSPSPLFILMLWTFASFIREFFRSDKGHSLLRIMTTLLGVAICGLFLGHLVLFRDLRLVSGEGFKFVGREVVFFLVLVIWTTDVGAWLVGKTVGRTKMTPTISPGKTIEGSLGGTLLACLVGWIFQQSFLKTAWGPLEAVFYAFCISITAQISDLVESLAKRSFGVKNSSELLPGHGGILDRFDSFIFSAPFFYYLLVATGRFQ